MKRFATEAIHPQQAKTKAEESLKKSLKKRHEHHRRTHPLPLVQATVPCVRSMYVRMYVRTKYAFMKIIQLYLLIRTYLRHMYYYYYHYYQQQQLDSI